MIDAALAPTRLRSERHRLEHQRPRRRLVCLRWPAQMGAGGAGAPRLLCRPQPWAAEAGKLWNGRDKMKTFEHFALPERSDVVVTLRVPKAIARLRVPC